MNRREFLLLTAGAAGVAAAQPAYGRSTKTIRVTVWDERQQAQKQAYENYLGGAVADHLKSKGFEVKSVGLDDPDQGLPASTLDGTDVLIWWGHQRHEQVKRELVDDIAKRVHEGRLNFIGLHSAHWSLPFMEIMNLRAIDDAMKTLTPAERKHVEVVRIPVQKHQPSATDPLTPSFTKEVQSGGHVKLTVTLPLCVFPVVRNDGKPGHITTMLPNHPIAKGLPAKWDVPATEEYSGAFHVPKPDALIFTEKWDTGGQFDSGCYWRVGKGKVFYFRPGHETYPIYKQELPLQVVENAVRYIGG